LIFSQVAALVRGEPVSEVPLARHFELMLRYLDASVRYFGEKQACLMMRSRLGWFTKGLHYSSHFRESIKRINSRTEAVSLIHRYLDTLLEVKKAEQIREPSDSAGNFKLW
jgi:tRNA-dihydrouridine synthase